MLGFAVAFEVLGAGKHLRAQRAQFAGHQVRIGQGSGAQRHVKLARDQVHLVIAQVHVDADLRITGLEFA
ncbi:hypothetical protein D3C77_801760 [compost metagenome]